MNSERALYILILIGLLAPFSLGLILHPSSTGAGTHEQLGLPPCSFKTTFGIPCPLCGLSTFFANLVRLNLSQAFLAHPGGFVLLFFIILALPVTTRKIIHSDFRISEKTALLSFKAFKVSLMLWLIAWCFKIYITWGAQPALLFANF